MNIYLFLISTECIIRSSELGNEGSNSLSYDKAKVSIVQDILREYKFEKVKDFNDPAGAFMLKIKLLIMPRSLVMDENYIKEVLENPFLVFNQQSDSSSSHP